MSVPQAAPERFRLKRKRKVTDYIVVNPKRKGIESPAEVLLWKGCYGNLPTHASTLPVINCSHYTLLSRRQYSSKQLWQSDRTITLVTLSFVYVVLLWFVNILCNSVPLLCLHFWSLGRPQQYIHIYIYIYIELVNLTVNNCLMPLAYFKNVTLLSLCG